MNWVGGISLLFSVGPLLSLLIGCLLGLFMGALPGLGPVFILTVLLPLTVHVDTIDALVMLVAGYTAAVYGGAITAVVFKVPGHPGNVATTFDGPAMASQGRAGEAVVAIGIAGAIGGIVATGFLVFVAPVILSAALKLQPVDYFMLAVFGLSMVAAVSRGRVIIGLILGGVGVLISTIGPDVITGTTRFAFGSKFLQSNGVPLALVAVGIFAIGSGLVMMEENWKRSSRRMENVEIRSGIRRGIKAAASHPLPIIRSSLLGVLVGVIPGLGITMSNLAAYAMESRIGRHLKWGNGNVIGVMAAEAADGATLISELIPAFTLGIPGAATSALMLEALSLHGLIAGPGFFQSGSTVAAFLLALPLAQILIAVLGIASAPIVVRIARIDPQIIGPALIVIGAVGAYVVNGTVSDIVIGTIFGLVGYILIKLKLPLAPIVMGTLLGPLAEESLGRVMILDKATHSFAFFQPMAVILVGVAIVGFVGPNIGRFRRIMNRSPRPSSNRGRVRISDEISLADGMSSRDIGVEASLPGDTRSNNKVSERSK